MRYCKKMQKVIEEICQKYGIDWEKEEAFLLEVSPKGCTPLTIEREEEASLFIAHYEKEADEPGWLVESPSILFATTPKGWIPLEMVAKDKNYICAYKHGNSTKIENEQILHQITDYAEGWADQLRENYL